MRLPAPLALALPLLSLAAALPDITRAGKYLYDDSGDRFYIKGVAYQPQGELAASSEANSANGGFPEPSSFHDPLSSPENCTRDVPYLQQLGINAVRVYSVNSSLDHDACMKTLSDAGIYLLLDLSLPLNGSIDRSSPSWTTNLLDQYTATINVFNAYDNVLGYNVGNEVVNLASNTNALPFVKAAARDTKAYLKSIGSSAFVGYAAVDGDADFRNSVAEYLTCGDDDTILDIYGFNNYEWCGDQDLSASHWDTITSGFSDLPIPTYMSEFGCITSPPRLWTEVAALYVSPVSDVFSGGVAFSYFPTSDGYGIVTISDDGKTISTTDDFTRLSTQFNATSPANSPSQSSSNSNSTTTTCPAESSSLLASSDLPPTPDASVCSCLEEKSFACHLTDAALNSPTIIGSLLDYTCSLLGSSNSSASCDTISGNGTSGSYGQLSSCSPAIKLEYVMSVYYQSNPVSTSCDFDGNATLSTSSSKPNTASDADTAAQSCLAAEKSGGVFTPSASSAAASATSTSTSSSSAAATSDSASSAGVRAVALSMGGGGVVGVVLGVVGVLVGGGAVLM
ncbi:hypothetical protein B9479_007474 [Cryptococcus floricola]|uniref:1,3-beta-glucanosyltransferase n=1 Tax=Cryptococcus floricola TaxID=2591691 RepID=A0A5D3AK92_9TREE|nr:hypothetical protein B9479_007474 [Cryptococcus floricola]